MQSPGYPLRSWKGDESIWPETALTQGPVRISGAVQSGASWHAVRDRLGWTTVVLVGRPEKALETHEVDAVVRACADRCFDPLRTARALWHRFGLWMEEAEVGVLRIGPHGRLVELLNVSLPAIIHWDPSTGALPFEPVGAQHLIHERAPMSEMIRLEPGALLLGITRGVLPHEAGWKELNGFVRSLSLDLYGGQLADVAPAELARLLESSWDARQGPRAIVAIGLPPAQLCVA